MSSAVGDHEGLQETQGTVGPLAPRVPKVGQSCSPLLLDPGCRWATIGKPYPDGGYWRLTIPAEYRPHLVQDNNNKAYLHRLVLCDAIGPGPHACNWCKWPGLQWDVTDPKDPRSLVADHKNGRENDCRLSNLVASCQWCNNNRSVVDDLGIPWSTFEGLPPTIAARGSLYNHKTKAPTKAAYKLASAPAPVVSDPSPGPPPTAGAETQGRAKLPIRKGLVRWEDLVG